MHSDNIVCLTGNRMGPKSGENILNSIYEQRRPEQPVRPRRFGCWVISVGIDNM